MDRLIKQQSMALLVALFIGVLFADNQNSRKLFGGYPLQLFVQNFDELAVVEVNSGGQVNDIMEAAQIDGNEFVLTYDGKQLCPTDGIADSGLSAESVLIVVQKALYSHLDDAMGDMTDCRSFGFIFDPNLERIEFEKERINLDEALWDEIIETGYLNMNDTNIESFQEFKNEVEEYLNNRGFARTDQAFDVDAEFTVEQIFIQVDADNVPISMKLGNQYTYQTIKPYFKEIMHRFEKRVADGHIGIGGKLEKYTLEKSSVIDGIETHQYRLLATSAC